MQDIDPRQMWVTCKSLRRSRESQDTTCIDWLCDNDAARQKGTHDGFVSQPYRYGRMISPKLYKAPRVMTPKVYCEVVEYSTLTQASTGSIRVPICCRDDQLPIRDAHNKKTLIDVRWALFTMSRPGHDSVMEVSTNQRSYSIYRLELLASVYSSVG